MARQPNQYSKEIAVTGTAGSYSAVITVTFNVADDIGNAQQHMIDVQLNGENVENAYFSTKAQAASLLTAVETKVTNALTDMANREITDPVEIAMRNRGYDLVRRKR